MKPLYTTTNCTPAYELRWSLALFANADLPRSENWLATLKAAVERDGVRLLEHRAMAPVQQFLLSTKPCVAPPAIVKSVKGRLAYLLRPVVTDAFRRNFSLSSVGESRREVVESYVANQLGHHRMADLRAQERLAQFQIVYSGIDLAESQFSSHGRYIYNLHLVLVHDRRWCDVCEERLERTRDMLQKVAAKKQYRLSRMALLADHLHLTLGGNIKESPEEMALACLNNLAFAHGMRPIYQQGYYVGTFGEYDLGAIRRRL